VCVSGQQYPDSSSGAVRRVYKEIEPGESVRSFAHRHKSNPDELWSLNETHLKSLPGTFGTNIKMDQKLKDQTYLYLPPLKTAGRP